MEKQGFPVTGKSLPEPFTLYMTWTTYGNWLPGDRRGWRKSLGGPQPPQPRLEAWCRERLTESPVKLTSSQREEVESVVKEHAAIRKWELHAISARSNHVQLAVTACEKPEKVRDQLKANATNRLRRFHSLLQQKRIWTRGGDIQLLKSQEDLEQVIIYIMVAQDRMGLGR